MKELSEMYQLLAYTPVFLIILLLAPYFLSETILFLVIQSFQPHPDHVGRTLERMTDIHQIAGLLLAWYDRCARTMPWRGIHDPYKTWVSETMLQQTRVETVIPYYFRFISRFPTLQDLAAADEQEVLKMWEGLGYYSRARNLLKGARQVMEWYGGILPRDPQLLRNISGIGPYTAGAVASIAYEVPVPAVDGNVFRVFSRLFGIRKNIRLPEIRKDLESLAASAVPPERAGDYNQAVMDLGATVCVPGTPECSRCPLSSLCDAFEKGDAPDLPVIPGSAPQKIISYTVPVLLSDSRTLVRKRTESLLNGLWCFPLLECKPQDCASFLYSKWKIPAVPSGEPVTARHVFTHLIWQMTIMPLEAGSALSAPSGYCWISAAELDSLAFPSAMNIPLSTARNLFSRE